MTNQEKATHLLYSLQDECESIDKIMKTMTKTPHLMNEDALSMLQERRAIVIDRIEKCISIIGFDSKLESFSKENRKNEKTL